MCTGSVHRFTPVWFALRRSYSLCGASQRLVSFSFIIASFFRHLSINTAVLPTLVPVIAVHSFSKTTNKYHDDRVDLTLLSALILESTFPHPLFNRVPFFFLESSNLQSSILSPSPFDGIRLLGFGPIFLDIDSIRWMETMLGRARPRTVTPGTCRPCPTVAFLRNLRRRCSWMGITMLLIPRMNRSPDTIRYASLQF